MTYAMTLDNSWELMTEEEMYDVNGGGTLSITISSNLIGIAVGAIAGVLINSGVTAGLTALSVYLMGLLTIPIAASGGLLAAIATPFVAAVVGVVGGLIVRHGVNGLIDLATSGNIPSVTYSKSKWYYPNLHIPL